MAPNGRVDMAWHDFRNDTQFTPQGTRQTQTYWDVYYTYSDDGGLTWAQEIRMSDRSMHRNEGYSFNSQYGLVGPVGMASTDATAFVAWGDSRRGSTQLPVEDHYLASAVHDRDGPAEGGSGSNTARDVALGAVITLVAVGLFLAGAALLRREQPAGAPSKAKVATG
ncbi:MAG: hypothetical protein ACRD2W_23870 [Acidimicrobiales bacterium]